MTAEKVNQVDHVALAAKFVERAEAAKRIAELDAEITEEVLKIGKTTEIAGIKATYYKPSAVYDYQEAALIFNDGQSHGSKNLTFDEAVRRNSKETISISTAWKTVLDELGADLDALKSTRTKPARVAIKVTS
jgi:hypothetical protein